MRDSDAVSPFADLSAYTRIPRVTGLVLDPSGRRLVASLQQPDATDSRYVTSLWEIPLGATGRPARLTYSEKGETSPAFTAAGDLLFVSARPGDDAAVDEAALWALPQRGEAHVVARRAGGLGGPVAATGAATVVVTGNALLSSSSQDDADRRRERSDRGVSAILHTGMPIRYWDRELGDLSTRLLRVDGDGTLVDLTPDAGQALTNAAYSVSADGARVATTWRIRRAGGTFFYGVAVIETATGARMLLLDADGVDHQGPRIAPDGRRVVVLSESKPGFDAPWHAVLRIAEVDGDGVVDAEVGDLFPHEWIWSRDGSRLFVAGDLHGRGGLVEIDARTGSLTRSLGDGGVHSDLSESPDGSVLYALRSSIDQAPCPVAVDLTGAGGQSGSVRYLPTPAPTPELPGRLVELAVPVRGGAVHAWLCLPGPADTPAPVMTWIHGGPFASYNSWNWRWNPWVAVAHGWAVILPDPALSTGHGRGWIERAWPYLAEVVWSDVEAVLDEVLRRPEVDPDRLACLGGSFGGFMANWIAGHSDRFAAIVSHAGLWAADQQHTTTDAAAFKTGLFGRPADHPDWYAQNSPHHFVADIVTPVLLTHGSRDYRVPVSESLRCWWDLVDAWQGDPGDLPHRFLQFTGENHWILSPSNAQVWWHTVLGFCAHHVCGEDWTPSPLLP